MAMAAVAPSSLTLATCSGVSSAALGSAGDSPLGPLLTTLPFNFCSAWSTFWASAEPGGALAVCPGMEHAARVTARREAAARQPKGRFTSTPRWEGGGSRLLGEQPVQIGLADVGSLAGVA